MQSSNKVDSLLYQAWAVIANAGMFGSEKSPNWESSAIAWRDSFHAWLLEQGSNKSKALDEVIHLPVRTEEEISTAIALLMGIGDSEQT